MRFWGLLSATLAFAAAHHAVADEVQNLSSINKAVVAYVLGRAEAHARYEITTDPLDTRLQLPACTQPLGVFAPPGFRPVGTTTLGVRCNSQRSWIVYVPARIKVYKKVAVLANTITRAAHIRANDVILREYDVSNLTNGYYVDAQNVVGKLAKRALTAGLVLTPSQLSAPRWVSRGEFVTLLVDVSGLQVRAQGEALSDGSENDIIKARNVLSGKIVDGVVTAPGTVQIRM